VRRRAVVVVAALGVALLALSIVSDVVFHVNVDPTESTFAVTLRNDTSAPVVVGMCAATCRSFHERVRLEPGHSVAVNTSADNVANWWSVSDAVGKTVGCWPLRYGRKVAGLVVGVSARARCPNRTGEDDSLRGVLAALGLAAVGGGIGVASMTFATLAAHRRLRRWGLHGGRAAALTALAALVAAVGGWLVFDCCVVCAEGVRLVRRTVPAS